MATTKFVFVLLSGLTCQLAAAAPTKQAPTHSSFDKFNFGSDYTGGFGGSFVQAEGLDGHQQGLHSGHFTDGSFGGFGSNHLSHGFGGHFGDIGSGYGSHLSSFTHSFPENSYSSRDGFSSQYYNFGNHATQGGFVPSSPPSSNYNRRYFTSNY